MGWLFFVLFFVVFFGLIIYGYIKKRRQEKAMAAFALQRGWTALSNDAYTLGRYVPHYLQDQGSDIKYDMAYQATVEGVQLVFFRYQYTERDISLGDDSQSQSTDYVYTVIQTTLTRSRPTLMLLHHIFLSKLAHAGQHDGLEKLTLEGDFNDHFDTYITPGSEVEALSLLTPDVMALLESGQKQASLEFNGQLLMLSIETDSLTPAGIMPILNNAVILIKKVEAKPHMAADVATGTSPVPQAIIQPSVQAGVPPTPTDPIPPTANSA